MPIYEYACDACGGRLEAMQKMSEVPLSTCPACGAPALRKLMSAAGVHVKDAPRNAAPTCGAGACPACLAE
jgi:putative FmdB family regulatory protein